MDFSDIQMFDCRAVSYPDKYCERANLNGAKVLNRKTVFQREHSDITSSDEEGGLCQQLQKDFHRDSYYVKVMESLTVWPGGETGAVWLSDTLFNDLAVPLDCPPPDSFDYQVLLLAPEVPAFLLTVYDPERILRDHDIHDEEESRSLVQQETENVELFCMQMGKLLTSAMLNYCACDFILLPVTLVDKEFSTDALKQKVEEQMKETRQYFRGPSVLKEPVYRQLKAAVTAVAAASYVPRLLQGSSSCEDTLILMDREWRGVVSLLVEKLTRQESHETQDHVTYSRDSWLKMATAVMEVARRLSYAEEVVIVTEKDVMMKCCGALKRKIKEETGIELRLTVDAPSNDVLSSNASYVIVMDHPKFQPKMSSASILHVTCSSSLV